MFKTLIIFFSLLLCNSFAIASNIEFNEAEAPYFVIERAFQTAQQMNLEDIPTTEETYSKTKTLSILDLNIQQNTKMSDILNTRAIFLVRSIKKVVVPAVPGRGPLFPGKPEVVTYENQINFCNNKCETSKDLGTQVAFEIGARDNILKISNKPYAIRLSENTVVLKLLSDTEFYLAYGWIQ